MPLPDLAGMPAATPARLLDLPRLDGCAVLCDSDVGRLDGGEHEIRAILAGARDRSSLSDELAAHDGSWQARYHLSKERANIVRPLAIAPGGAILEIGAGLLAVLAAADDDALASWLGRWRAAVEAAAEEDGPTCVDLVPHNFIVAGDRLVAVDEEWFDPELPAAAVVARGLLHTAFTLSDRCPPQRWPGCETVADLLRHLARLAGAPEAAGTDADLEREAELLTRMARPGEGEPAFAAAVARQLEALRATLARPLAEGALGDREHLRGRFERRAHELHLEVDRLHAEVARRDREIERLQALAAQRAGDGRPRRAARFRR